MGASQDNTLILSIIALVVAVIGAVIAAVGLSRSGESNITVNGFDGGSGSGSSALSGNNVEDDRIWLMAIGDAKYKTEYLDEISGEIKGFNVDMVNAVCRIARKNCKFVVDIYTNCWDSNAGQTQRGGTGLMGSYFDACTAWIQSYVRHRTFQFTNPFAANPSDVVFVVKAGNRGRFDHRDISGKVIGFQDGWIFDEFCVARDPNIGGTPIETQNIRHYHDRDALLAALLDGSIDAIFDIISYWSTIDGVEVVDEHMSNCAIAGRSMMMRKDNPMVDWWNPAFEILVKSPEYQLICKDLLEKHGDIPGPTPEELCFNYRS